MKLPHAPAVPQVAVQFTPALPVLGTTVAVRAACDPTDIVAGGKEDIVTTFVTVVTMVAIVVAVFVGSVVDAAVMVTVPPVGTAEGPVYATTVPLAE